MQHCFVSFLAHFEKTNFFVVFWFIIFFVLTLWTPRTAGSGNGGCRGGSPLLCTHVGRAIKKQGCFEEIWMNFQKILVFLVFIGNFSKYSRAEWVKKRIVINMFSFHAFFHLIKVLHEIKILTFVVNANREKPSNYCVLQRDIQDHWNGAFAKIVNSLSCSLFLQDVPC